jgi:hypothetical protein
VGHVPLGVVIIYVDDLEINGGFTFWKKWDLLCMFFPVPDLT